MGGIATLVLNWSHEGEELTEWEIMRIFRLKVPHYHPNINKMKGKNAGHATKQISKSSVIAKAYV